MRVLLIRHGLTDANASNVIQGHQPTPLNALGLHQARLLAQRLARSGPKFDVLISSDLLRAMQTADPISRCTGIPVIADSHWRERCFGPWEGTQRDVGDIWRAAAGEFDPPGAESASDFQGRIGAALRHLPIAYPQCESVAVITHGGPCRVVLRMFKDGTLPLADKTFAPALSTIANCSIMHLECTWERLWKLLALNDTRHLPESERTDVNGGV